MNKIRGKEGIKMKTKEFKETILSISSCFDFLTEGINEMKYMPEGFSMIEFIAGFCYFVKCVSDDETANLLLAKGLDYYNEVKKGGYTRERS